MVPSPAVGIDSFHSFVAVDRIFSHPAHVVLLVVENKIVAYTRELREVLPARLFDPVRSRLFWLAAHYVWIAFATYLIAAGIGGWWITVAASLTIGHSFACTAFVAHEVLHGAVIKSRRWQLIAGWLGFLPFTLSPRLWIAWHNRTHHAHTMDPSGSDPDAGASLASYRGSRLLRIFDHVTLGTRRPLGILTMMIGFNGQCLRVLFTLARQEKYLSKSDFVRALAETAAAVACWTVLALVIGWVPFVFAFLIPLVIGNVILMSYIMTNHNLSPMTAVNDPLVNSLSVTTPRIFELAHFGFGYHVEHHLFPKMSSRHARRVRSEILSRWPERYQSMPLIRAVGQLWKTCRIYSSATMLHDPRTGREWPVLLPDEPALATERVAA